MPAHTTSERFLHTAKLLQDCADLFAEPVHGAAEVILQALMADGKLLVAGNGACASLANTMSAYMMTQLDCERMGLAAIALCNNAALLSSLARQQHADDLFAQQIHALGKPHDVLCVLSTDGQCTNLQAAIQAAHERDIRVLALTGADGGALAGMLSDHDILLNVPSAQASEVIEVHLATIHALSWEIDQLLLGGL
ncbi:SIS domain-containing protein [Snodgrassella sp. CFCC 13594]|uniref:D-sedoheptulose-7-phosphate isomerase n=1 Tax=Snodgrassella sp. CFCC 13594 TaxID=1775559 RepID=UPI0008350028|nr:SIS domain-containing protein [Snodgrassella sp. CFCC 13594]